MVKFIKSLSIFLMVSVTAVFSVVFYGQGAIPDNIVLLDDQGISVGKLYTIEKSGDYTDAGSNRGNGTDTSFSVDISLLNIIPVKKSTVHISQRDYVVPGGEIFGLKLYSDGVMIVGTNDVITASGSICPAKRAGLQAGDIILKINGVPYNESAEVAAFFKANGQASATLTVSRNGSSFEKTLVPALSTADGLYKAGIWIRDSAAGIGTLTFYDPESNVFASLGHAVCDIDTSCVIPILNGEAVTAKITGCYKSQQGKAGELSGIFGNSVLGPIMINGNTGVYGILNGALPRKNRLIPVATEKEVSTGKAQIIATVDTDAPAYYDVEIIKLNTDDEETRNMTIRITDPLLLKKTGGIVQGMSGSPIIQNGMLVGAVTHVFINDSAKGYGIFAENMIETADYLRSYLYSEAS